MNANFVSNESSNDTCWLNVLCVHSKINIHFYFLYVLFEVHYLENSIIDIKFKNWTKLFKNNTLTLSLSNMVWNKWSHLIKSKAWQTSTNFIIQT